MLEWHNHLASYNCLRKKICTWLKETAVGQSDDHNGLTHSNIWLLLIDNGILYDRKGWAHQYSA